MICSLLSSDGFLHKWMCCYHHNAQHENDSGYYTRYSTCKTKTGFSFSFINFTYLFHTSGTEITASQVSQMECTVMFKQMHKETPMNAFTEIILALSVFSSKHLFTIKNVPVPQMTRKLTKKSDPQIT